MSTVNIILISYKILCLPSLHAIRKLIIGNERLALFFIYYSKTFAKTSILFFKQFIYTYINRYKSSDQRHPSILYAMFYFLTILSLFLQQNVNVNHFSSVSAIIFFIF